MHLEFFYGLGGSVEEKCDGCLGLTFCVHIDFGRVCCVPEGIDFVLFAVGLWQKGLMEALAVLSLCLVVLTVKKVV